MSSLLIIDDEPGVCWAFRKLLEARGHSVRAAATAEEGLRLAAAERPDAILLDVRLPGMDGLEALRRLRAEDPEAVVLVMTAHGTLETAVQAMKAGAYDYLTKPVDLDAAERVIERALAQHTLSAEVARLRSVVARGIDVRLVGAGAAMQQVFKKIGAVCGGEATVLVLGESGTGKELAARAIHSNSARARGPFVAIHCAAIPENLLESELFGHEKGAFTGADQAQPGKLESANGGTLFLDEIAEMPPPSQAKLLRFLEDRRVTRLGATEGSVVDVRILAATHADLRACIAEGRFREDLFFRLHVVTIELPPLRDRLDDLPLLAAHFLDALGAAGTQISESALAALRAHAWPGNVRELRNAIEHAVTLTRDRCLRPEHLPPSITTPPATPAAAPNGDATSRIAAAVETFLAAAPAESKKLFAEFESAWERPFLRAILERFDGNQVRMAERLGITRTTLRKKLAKYGIR
ncbi:MAG: sigma-54-dependent Fis family transcriptional regulator [Planctomycetes bacterium]|nr:sigma-54-dependent Fis family transcriptional regulator [Planctomycetota bacterium]